MELLDIVQGKSLKKDFLEAIESGIRNVISRYEKEQFMFDTLIKFSKFVWEVGYLGKT